MNSQKYTHGIFSAIDYFGIGMITLPTLVFLDLCIEWVCTVAQGDSSKTTLEWILALIIWAAITIWVTLIIGRILNLFPKLTIVNEGIRVRLFGYWFFWKLIPWKKINSLQPSPRGNHIWILSVDEELTLWHKSLGNIYGQGNNSEIAILNTLNNRNEFISKVKICLDKDEDSN